MIYLAAIAVSVIACNRIDEQTSPVDSLSFNATVVETKTILVDNVKTHWVSDDAISVFGTEGANWWFGTKGNGAAVTFDQIGNQTVEDGLVASQPYALYPYDASASVSGNVMTTQILKDQYAVAGGFPSNQKPLLVAKADADGNLAFQHASSVVKFTLTDSDIEWMYIKGNDEEELTGTSVVTVGDEISTVVEGSWTETAATLKNEDGSPLAPGTYYMVMAPMEFETGITMEWGPAKDGFENWKSTTNKVVAEAGHILNVGTLGYKAASSDATAPALSAFSEYNITLASGSSKTISVSATDETGLASITCMIYSSDWSTVLETETIPVSGTTATAEYVLDYAEAGSFLFVAYATDEAGNDSEWWNTSLTVIQPSGDTVAPSIKLTSPATAVAGETYHLVVNFADESGITECWPKVYLANADWSSYPALAGSLPSGYWTNAGNANWGTTVQGTNFNFELDITFPTADTYYVYVYGAVSDANGNSTDAGQTLVGTITVTAAQ